MKDMNAIDNLCCVVIGVSTVDCLSVGVGAVLICVCVLKRRDHPAILPKIS